MEILITNSYILHGSDDLREPVLEQGLHDLLGFDGAIMTDSGSFQLAEYGDIDVTTRKFCSSSTRSGPISARPSTSRRRRTWTASGRPRNSNDTGTARTRCTVDTGEMLVSAPVQGATYPDLRERAAASRLDRT